MESSIATIFLVVVIGLVVVFLLSLIADRLQKLFRIHVETPEKQAGRMGERIATAVISEVLREEDTLLTNVPVYYDGKQTELDNVIINSNGVFIIEVKNLRGVLSGDEESFDWIQTKSSSAGEFYQKTVKNPIGQVKRQIYILSKFLQEKDVHVWIEGYVFFVERNSPIKSGYILETRRDIDRAIHRSGQQKLSKREQQFIGTVLLSSGDIL